MKTLLICPGPQPSVPLLSEKNPLVALPLLGETLVETWLVHLARLGAREVTLLASDRVEEVRQLVGDGSRWGLTVDTVWTPMDLTVAEARARFRGDVPDEQWLAEPNDILVLSQLPGLPEGRNLFESYASWFEAQRDWLVHGRTAGRVGWREIRPGVHVSLRARISEDAILNPPCWIGDKVYLGSGVTIGPMAVIENCALIENEAEVVCSTVGPDTYVGQYTQIQNSLAWGETLIDWKTGAHLRVADSFLLGALRTQNGRKRNWKLADLWPARDLVRGRRAASTLSPSTKTS